MTESRPAAPQRSAIGTVIVVAACLLLPPGLYSIVAYRALAADLTADIAILAAQAGQPMASGEGAASRTETARALLARHIRDFATVRREHITVVDDAGATIAAAGAMPVRPVIERSTSIGGATEKVGALRIQRSLRPLIIRTAELALLGLALAATVYVGLGTTPLHRFGRGNGIFWWRRATPDYTNTLLTAAIEGSLDAILVVDQTGRIVTFNQNFVDLWRVPATLIAARDDAPVLAAVASELQDPEAFRTRVLYLYDHPDETGRELLYLKDGRVFDRYTQTLYGPTDENLGRIWFFRDVTEQKKAEDTVRNSEEKYRNLVESTTDYIWQVDTQGHYTYYSPAAVSQLGYAPGELVGKTPFDMMAPAEAARVREAFAAISATRAPFSQLENTILRKDGTPVVMETSGVPIFDAAGNYCGYRGIERDITGRKRTEQARQEAEAALLQRDALLHAVAVSATELLTAPSLDEAISKSLQMVSTTLRIDRMIVLERGPDIEPVPVLRYAWQAPGIKKILSAEFFDDPRHRSPDVFAWQKPLIEGNIVVTHASRAPEAVRRMLAEANVESLLQVPVTVDGKYWGQVAFDSVATGREWADSEIEILRTLADLIGNAIQRDRYVKEMADANRIVQNTPTILFRLRGEPALPMIYISQNITLLGYEPAALIAAPQFYKSLIHPDDGDRLRNAMDHALRDHAGPGAVEVRLMTSRGQYRWFEDRFTPIVDAAGRIIEIEGLLIDITERKAAEERIALLARTDPLTGLANRSTFIERLRHAFVAARRGTKPFALLYIDLDRFKDINDTLGHPFGDELLITTAERLRHAVRKTDLIARLGGDEFAVLQSDLDEPADAGALATKLRSVIGQPMHIGTSDVTITISIGISVYSADVEKPEDLLARADVALYRAKEEGRDQFRFHTKELDVQVREEVDIADKLRSAISQNQLELYYQPQVELATGHIVGMEALLRWNHPTRGVLSPAIFIPVAERTGSIIAIGRWVLDGACRQMRAWRDAGIAPQTIAVNISASQLKAPGELIQLISDTLTRWDLRPIDLELDVTESMLARVALAQNDVLERLHAMGIKISIDDFGTKYSTLDYLRTYRVNRIKIPPALIDAATRNHESLAMVRAIVGIARELNIDVVAQGVENELQWEVITETSPASKVQGYYYSEPLPAHAAEELLRRGVISPTGGTPDNPPNKSV